MSRESGCLLGVEKVETLEADRGPQRAGEPRPTGQRRVGGAEEERGEIVQERKQPNLGWALRMENSRGGGGSRALREAEGAGRRARVRGLRGVAGE